MARNILTHALGVLLFLFPYSMRAQNAKPPQYKQFAEQVKYMAPLIPQIKTENALTSSVTEGETSTTYYLRVADKEFRYTEPKEGGQKHTISVVARGLGKALRFEDDFYTDKPDSIGNVNRIVRMNTRVDAEELVYTAEDGWLVPAEPCGRNTDIMCLSDYGKEPADIRRYGEIVEAYTKTLQLIRNRIEPPKPVRRE